MLKKKASPRIQFPTKLGASGASSHKRRFVFMYAPNMFRFSGNSPRLTERQSIMPRQVDYRKRRGNIKRSRKDRSKDRAWSSAVAINRARFALKMSFVGH